ncbi:MAG: tetratricopeptide repeat protein [Magnetococcales bacterium]|nr:tetratricopeptide repeat protein [Magnetococcales bacterium]
MNKSDLLLAALYLALAALFVMHHRVLLQSAELLFCYFQGYTSSEGEPERLLEEAEEAFVERHDPATAERAARRVLDMDPQYFEAYVLLTDILVDRGRKDEAIHTLGRGVAFDPTRFEATSRLANLMNEAGRHEEACALLKGAWRFFLRAERDHRLPSLSPKERAGVSGRAFAKSQRVWQGFNFGRAVMEGRHRYLCQSP